MSTKGVVWVSRAVRWGLVVVALVAGGVAQAASGVWNKTSGGPYNWLDSANWKLSNVPNGPGETAGVTNNISAAHTINLNASITNSILTIGDTGSSWFGFTIAPGTGGGLVFDNSGGAVSIAKRGSQASDAVSAPITLAGNATFNNSRNDASHTLTLSGGVGEVGGARSVTITGGGTSALVILSGASTYSGDTTITSGNLRLNHADALPATGLLTLDGGALELQAPTSFTRSLGSGSGNVRIPGGVSGFSSRTASVSININNDGSTLLWGGSDFAPSELVLNNSAASAALAFENGLDLNGATRTNTVNANTANLNGNIVNTAGGTYGVTKKGAGQLNLKGNGSTYAGLTTVQAGILGFSSIANANGTASALGAPANSTDGTIKADNGATGVTLSYLGTTDATSDRIFDMAGTTGGLTLNTTSTGALTLTGNVTASVNGAKTLTLGGASTTNTLQGTISDSAAGVTSLTKTDAGMWILSGASSFKGKTSILGGTLSINSIANADNVTASSLGAPAAADGAITMGSGSTGATLRYTGSGDTTDRVINLASSTGGITIDHSGTGLLKFTADQTAAASAKKLTLQGSTAGIGEYAGKIVNGAGTVELTKAGTNTWTLSNANTYSGTTTVSAGTLVAANNGALGTSAVTLSGGKLDLAMDGTPTTAANVTVSTGGGAILLNKATAASAGDTKTINSLSVGATTTIDKGANVSGGSPTLAIDSVLRTTTSVAINVTNGVTLNVLGVVTNGSTTARTLTFVGDGNVVLANVVSNGASALSLTFNGPTATVAGTNVNTGTTTISAGAVNLTGALGNAAVALSGGALSLQSSGAVRQNTLTLTGTGNLTQTAANGLSGTAALTVNSATASATLSQPNDHTGATTLTAGALTLSDFGAVGSSWLKPGGGTLSLRGDVPGTFLSASNTVTASTVIDVGPASSGSGNALNLGPTTIAAATLGVSGNSGYSLGLGAVTLTGAAVFNPTNANLNVDSVTGPWGLTLGGTTVNNSCGPLTMSTGSLTKNTASTWTLTGASTYTNTTTISAGSVNLAGTLGNTAVALSGGTLSLQNDGAITTKTLTVSGTGTLNQTVPNALSGTAALTVSSATATANLSEANNYTGATTISAGTVNVGGALGNTAVALSGGSLVLQGEGAINQNLLTISGTGRLTETAVNGLSGTAAVTVNGAGATGVLSRANSHTGATTLTAGALTLSDFGAVESSWLKLGGGTLSLRNDSAGTFLSASNTVTASTVIDVGPASSGSGNALGLGAINLGAVTLGSTGSSSYGLGLGAATLTGSATFNPTTASMAVDSVTGVNQNLTLGGTAASNSCGPITTGTGTLTKNAASDWTLSGTSTYSGATTISAGTLTVADGSGLTGGGAITVTNGTFRLNGTATGSGAVTVRNGGLLSGSGTIGGTRATTVNLGGTVNPGSAGTVGTLTANATTFNSGSTLAIDVGAGADNADRLVLNAGVTIQPGAQISLNELSTPDQPRYVLMTYTNYNYGAFTVSGALPSGYVLSYSTTQVELVQTGTDLNGIWISPSNGLWSATDNWQVGNVASGAGKQANFNTLNIVTNDTLPDAVAVSLDSARTIGSMIFGDTTTSSAAGWVLDNNGDPANVLTLEDAAPRITVNALGTGKVVTGNLTLAGTNGLTKAGTGGLVLNGANTYSGATTVERGALTLAGDNVAATGGVTVASGTTLNINHANALGVGPLNINGGTLNNTSAGAVAVATGNEQNWNAGFTFTGGNDLDLGTGAVALTTNISVATSASNLVVNGTVSGPWQLAKTGNGKLTLAGANTYTGPTRFHGVLGVAILADGGQPSGLGQSDSNASNVVVTGGNATIQYTGGSASSDRDYTVFPTRTLTFDIVDPSATLTLNGTCYTNDAIGTPSAALAKTGPGTLVINGDNQNRGLTFVNQGKLVVNGSTAGEGNNQVTGIGGVQVSSNATASGTGTINGTLDIYVAGSIVAPGVDGEAGGMLTTEYLRLAVGSVSVFEFNATTNDMINVTTNGIWKLFGSTVYLYAEGTTNAWTSNGTYNLIRAQDPLQDGVQNLVIGNPVTGKAYAFSLVDGWVAVTITTGEEWDGGSLTDDNWSSGLNWQSDTVPAAGVGLAFAGATRLAPNNDLTANTPFGGITFNASAESFILGGAAINLAGNVLNNSTNAQTINLPLVLEGGSRTFTAAMGDLTLGGVVDDAGVGRGVLKSGPYTLNLTADNTYLGGTSIAGGTLSFTGALASRTITVNGGCALGGTGVSTGAVTCSSGGTVAPGLSGVAGGVLTVGQLTFATGSTNAFEFSAAPTNDLIVVTANGGLAINGGGVCLYAEGTTNAWTTDGVYRLIRYSGALAGDVANWSVLNPAPGKSYALGASGSWILLTISSDVNVWDGGGADGNWQTGANWVADVPPSANDALTFAGATGLVATNDFPAATRFGNISFDATAGSFTLEGNDLNLVGNVVNHSSNSQTLNLPLVLDSATRTFNAASNSIAVVGTIGDEGQGFGLVKTGTNVLTLTGNNTYSGTTRANAGKLSVPVLPNGGTPSPLGASSSDPANLVLSGATLQYTGGSATTDRSFTPIATGTIEVAMPGATLELSGATPSVPGSIAKTGPGTLKLSGQNQNTGTTSVKQGTLEYGVDDALFTGGQVLLDGAALDLGVHDAHLASVTVTSGAIVGSGTLTATSAINFDGALSTNCAVRLAGSGMLSRTNSSGGTITLTGVNTYTGPTAIVAAGTLSVSLLANGGQPSGIGASSSDAANWVFGAAQGSGSILRYTGPSVEIDRNYTILPTKQFGIEITEPTTTLTLLGGTPVSDGFTKKLGPGTLVLAGMNLNTGITTNGAGTLQIGNGGTTGSLSTNRIYNSSALVFNRSDAYTHFGQISGTGTVTQAGTGLLTLSGVNTFTGRTFVNAGTLRINAETGLGGNPGTYAANQLALDGGVLESGASFAIDDANRGLSLGAGGGTFRIDTLFTQTVVKVISGPGLLTKAGTGDLLLSTTNTYTGGTAIHAGTLRLGFANALPYGVGTGNVAIDVDGLLDVSAFVSTLNGLDGAGTIDKSTNNATALVVGANNQSGEFTGVIQNSLGSIRLIKSGTGIQTLSGANTYSGITDVSNGTLRVNNPVGSGTGSGLVTVYTNATLGGVGAITGAVTVAGGSILAPGDGSGVGALTVKDLTVQDGANYAWSWDYPETGSNRTVVAGTLVLPTDVTVSVTNRSTNPLPARSVLFSYAARSGSPSAWQVTGAGPGLMVVDDDANQAILLVNTSSVVTAWSTAAGITYGQTLAAATLSSGASAVPGAFDYDAPTTAPTAGVYRAMVVFTPSDVATYDVESNLVDVAVAKAVPTVVTSPTASGIVYGQTLASSVLTGGEGSVAGAFSFTAPATAPAVGTHSAALTFTPTDTANYDVIAAGNVDVAVAKATPTVVTLPTASGIVYGQTLASSVLTGGAGSVAGTFSFTAPTTAPAAGTHSAALTFTPTDVANYEVIAAGNVNVAVAKATPTVVTLPTAGGIVYGQTLASSVLTGGAGSVAGAFSFTAPTTAPGVGVYSAALTFTPTDGDNYEAIAAGNVDVAVAKATPTVVTLPTASGIVYGQTLASSVLTGGAGSVAGAFSFTAPTTAPAAGNHGAALTFTPTDGANYEAIAAGNVDVAVAKATPTVVTPPTAGGIAYGQTLASSVLTGGAGSVAGAFSFTAPATAPGVGVYNAALTFTPTDGANYEAIAAGNVDVAVAKATPTVVTLPTAGGIVHGQTLASSVLTGGAGSVDGVFSFTAPTTAPAEGVYSAALTFTPTDGDNYEVIAAGNVDVVVAKTPPTWLIIR